MKQHVVGIFAHPDDEAFGPAGTLTQFAQEGYNVSLICVTNGDSKPEFRKGKYKKDVSIDLTEVRKQELLASADILGIENVYFLNYPDGMLCNNLYHDIAKKIEELLAPLEPKILMTFEPRGLTGHIDHIVVSMITTYIFHRSAYAKELWYYCFKKDWKSLEDNYFIYDPPGYTHSELDRIVEITPQWEKKKQALHAHQSQMYEIEHTIELFAQYPKKECFIIQKKQQRKR